MESAEAATPVQSKPGDAPGRLEPVYERIFERALPYLQTRHNEEHTRISWEFGARLLRHEGGDPHVVIPAILLHDIGWSQVPEELQLTAFGPNVKDPELRAVHEREGARMAAEVLSEERYPQEAVREIAEIVAGHDTRLEPLSRNDAIVKDADKLFRLSKVGFPIDCRRFGLDPDAHLAWLEARIERWFLTETAKRLARAEVEARREELRETSPHGRKGTGREHR